MNIFKSIKVDQNYDTEELIITLCKIITIRARLEDNVCSLNVYCCKHNIFSDEFHFNSPHTHTHFIFHLLNAGTLFFLQSLLLSFKVLIPRFCRRLLTRYIDYQTLNKVQSVFKHGGLLSLIDLALANKKRNLISPRKFKNVFNVLEINNLIIKPIFNFHELKQYAINLSICSSTRPDLIIDFFSQRLVRFGLQTKEGEILALFCIQEQFDKVSSDKKKKLFKIYGLARNHNTMTTNCTFKSKSEELRHKEICRTYNEFIKQVINQGIEYKGHVITKDNMWDIR